MARSLNVLADLRLSVDGETIDIRGSGDLVVVNLPSLQAGRRLFRSGPFASLQANPTGRLHQALRRAQLSVEVRLQGDPVARMGRGAHPGTLGRLLNLDGLELRPTQPLRAEMRRRPVVTVLIVGGLLVVVGWWLLGRET